ncbi:hypothetical protein BJX99DRAFT_258423 [Aspergillus californicus]
MSSAPQDTINLWAGSSGPEACGSVNEDRENLEMENEAEASAVPRKRRRKYIAKACNECKRRKIKCNGEQPCGRCGRQRISCIYDNAQENGGNEIIGMDRLYEQMNAMQAQISSLTAAVHTLTQTNSGIARIEPGPRSYRRISITSKEATFQGPTTSGFSFDLAKSSLKERGIEVERQEDITREPSPLLTPPSLPAGSCHAGDPLWSISKTEALRLCRVYEEEMGVMYPVVDLDELLHHVNLLYGSLEVAWQRGPVDVSDGLDSDDVNILRLVFACALTAEASGSSELAMGLFATVREAADHYIWAAPEIKSITLLALVAILYFQIDEETLAWRTIGVVERMCLEKGLHRRETLKHPTVLAAGKNRVLKLFWSVRVLDLRWSFGTGMPFSVDDSDIDPWLPEPAGEETSYLIAMIRYSRIAGKAWRFISAFNNDTSAIKIEEMNYLDWQVLQWVAALPDSLRLRSPSGYAEGESRSLRRLRSLAYLRGNQLRMLIHRPVLHSTAHMMRFPTEVQTVVDMARDTIRFITQLHASSDIYQLQQVVFNWFLVSALMALFLAVAQNPSQFSGACREEFYMALELVKGVSTRSYISRRLWKSIKGLRRLGPQLMHRQGGDAVTTEGMEQAITSSVQSQTPDGAQMTQELKEWFEAVGSLEDQIMGVGSMDADAFQGGYMFDYSSELSSMMKDCF